MADQITRQEVEHIALLARLKMDDEQIRAFQLDLSSILHYVDQLSEVDTGGIEPTVHPLPVHNVLRDDAVQGSYDPDRALQNAPQRHGSFFAVPRVLDQNAS